MDRLLRLSRAIDATNTAIGRGAAWAVLAAVLAGALQAVLRKAFGLSSNAWLDLQPLLFGVVFLLCAPWTLMTNAHIRIDVVSSRLKPRTRQWIDVIGHALFLAPLCLVMVWTGWPYVVRSFLQNEHSANPGGLPLYPLKALVPLGFTLLAAQGLSELIKRCNALRTSADTGAALTR